MVTDLQITLADVAKRIDRGEILNEVDYPNSHGQIYLGNGFFVLFNSGVSKEATFQSAWAVPEPTFVPNSEPPVVSRSKHPPDAAKDSVAGMQLIAHIPSC